MEFGASFATEVMAALVILILIYANNFAIRQRTKKRDLFNAMLIVNEIVVVSDALTFVPAVWYGPPIIVHVLITNTYVLTSVMKLIFTSYLYVHISANATVSKKPFIIMRVYCLVELITNLVLCITGRMYYIQDGEFYPGSASLVYLILGFIAMLAFLIIIFSKTKILGVHGVMSVVPFIVIPVLSLVILAVTGLYITVTVFAFCMLILYTTLQSEHESMLYDRANIDELTGLFNRAAYEDEITALSKSMDESLVYASVDLNGLKVTNDSLGHSAGDELIVGAADCLKRAFGGNGKVFRIGGDEFAVIFFADEYNFKLETFKGTLEIFTRQWKGRIVDSMTLSVGYASKKEFPDKDIVELSKIADKRMYAAKSRFYTSNGVDRRGQNNAYKALSSLYTKILKINITDDSFSVIDMFSDEQIEEKGYSESIFDWLSGFAKSGQVHPDDMETFLSKTDAEYMRDYFKSGNHLLTFTYRRKYDDEFKQAIMEIIPTNEYTHEDQSLYLYVKSI